MINNSYSDPVKKMLDYIDAHLREHITAHDLAYAAGYSQFYSSRIFKREVGLTPFEYIRRRRMIMSAFALRGGKKVIDVAFDYVFDSQEGFTRAFSSGFGITPRRFSKIPTPEGWLIPYRYLNRQNKQTEECIMETKATVIFTQIVERPARKLLVYRSQSAAEYYDYDEEIYASFPEKLGMHPWEYLCGVKDALYEPIGVWLPEKMRLTEKGIYAHAVEVPSDYAGEVPEGFALLDLPACKYLIFQGEPYDENSHESFSACWDGIRKFNPEVYGYEYDEENPTFQLAPMGWRGYIEGRPIREIVKS